MLSLGQKGLFTTKEGLKIVYLGGLDKSTIANAVEYITFDDKDIDTLEVNCQNNDFEGVDLLLTNQWPKYIEKNAKELVKISSKNYLHLFNLKNFKENGESSDKFGSELIARLAKNIKPRYHFCGTHNVFYERQPYHNSKIYGREIHSTRFIALAKVNKKNKPKVANISTYIRILS